MSRLSTLIIVSSLVVVTGSLRSKAATIVTDFSSVNPLTFAYPSSTWSTPVNQFQSFVSGGVSGQQVLPIGGGNPTVSGGAGRIGLNLDLATATGLQLTARLLSGNQASLIQVLLHDSDGTILRFSYPTNQFNASTFQTVAVAFATATMTRAGTTPGFNRSKVAVYEVQGNYFDGGGAAAFRAQFDTLAIVAVPEPSTASLSLLGLGLLLPVITRRFRSAGTRPV